MTVMQQTARRTVPIVIHNGFPAIRWRRAEWQEPPTDEAAARAELRECQAAMVDIDARMGSASWAAHHDGRPITPHERKQWRADAITARQGIAQRARLLKDWLHEQAQATRWPKSRPSLADDIARLEGQVARLREQVAVLSRTIGVVLPE